MLNVAHVLPGPGERDADVFPLRERLHFRDKFGLALLELRARGGPFRALAKGPWALFIAISAHWQGNAEAWPSQSTLARFTGWSSRCVRDQTDALERGGFIRLRRERRADGSERLFYAPGLVTVAELAAFLERFPRGRAKPLSREPEETAGPRSLLPTDPPEAASGTPPEGSSAELSDLNWIEPSSCETTAPAITIEEEKPIEIAEQDRAVARAALAERMRRKHPARAAPRWFDAGELVMVAACSSAIDGDYEAKLQAHREALDGAYLVSRDGPPTARFIWGKLEHFLDHVERGRKKAFADVRSARLRETAAEASATPRALRVELPAVSPAQMRADIERIFGPVGRRELRDDRPDITVSENWDAEGPRRDGECRTSRGAAS
jgi:hypothetical protein